MPFATDVFWMVGISVCPHYYNDDTQEQYHSCLPHLM